MALSFKSMKRNNQELIYRSKRWKPILMLPVFLYCLFDVAGMIANGHRETMAYAGLIFCGSCLLVAFILLLPGSSYLRITDDGFETCILFRKCKVLWKDVTMFDVRTIYFSWFIPRRFVSYNFTPESGRMTWGNSLFGCVLADNYGFKANALAAFMNQRLNDFRTRAHIER